MLSRRSSFGPSVLALVALILFAGCGGKSEPWGAVSGTIVQGGKGVYPAAVLFSNRENGVEITAETDVNGNFVMRTDKLGGLPVGTYAVAVMPLREKVAPAQGMVFDKEAPPPPSPIPPEVQDITTTHLSAAVVEGPNELTFDLGGNAAGK
jgi:hypothetical protein